MKNISTQKRSSHVGLFLIFALSMLVLTSCGRIKRQIEGVATYPTTAEEVADMAKDYHSDAALVVTKADTQYVLYRRQGGESCFCMRYVSQHRCRHDFSGRGGQYHLGEPEQTVVLKRTGDNALTLTIDSLTIAVSNIIATDSALNFRFGFDKADRNAVLYLYDNAIKEPMTETSIQQMLFLALSLDSLVADAEEEMAETEHELELAELELELVDDELESAAQQQAFRERYVVYSKLDSLASVLGFANKEAKADDNHMIFKAWGGLGGSTNCYERMERMSAVANGHVAYSVHHKPKHRGCTFTARW